MSAIRSMQVERPVAVGDAADGTGVGAPAPKGGATPGDLSELMASFNEVTARLEATHGVLRGEVARLTEELRQANERLRRSERLAELGEMAAGIAHEIRNPLGSISLYSEMLAQDLAGDDESAQTARKIGSSVRRLDAIVRDVLDFARDLRVRPEAVETEDLIEAAAGSPRFGDASGDPSGVSIRVRIEPGAAVVAGAPTSNSSANSHAGSIAPSAAASVAASAASIASSVFKSLPSFSAAMAAWSSVTSTTASRAGSAWVHTEPSSAAT